MSAIKAEVPREPRFGRPLVIPIGGGKLGPYTRCTTYVDALEDTRLLEQWKTRMTAIGLSGRPDLQLATVAHKDDKDKLNEIVEQAIEYAKASAAATTGTALHSLTEQLDQGVLDLSTVPEAYRGDLLAYRAAAADFEMLAIEEFMVLDGLKIGGTPDRRVRRNTSGRTYIWDLKTGSIEYGMGKIAMQLAVYAHSQVYDPTTGARSDVTVDQDRAIICHLPAGSGQCQLYFVDIVAGWEAVQLAGQVRTWRKRRGLHTPLAPDVLDPDPLLTAIRAATEVGQLRALWADQLSTLNWKAIHTAAAAARKAEIVDAMGVSA